MDMQIVWGSMVEQYAPKFGISKAQIEDVYNKPDLIDLIDGNYITVKFYNGHAVLITFFMQGEKLHVMSTYKILPNMLSIDVEKAKALDILVNFMENFGVETEVPGVGKVKTYFNGAKHQFFSGILDVEKYVTAANGRI